MLRILFAVCWILSIPHVFCAVNADDTLFYSENLKQTDNEAFIFCYQIPNQEQRRQDTLLFYRLSGELYASQVTKHNHYHGNRKIYTEDGILKRQGTFRGQRPIGIHSYYDGVGDVQHTAYFNQFGKQKAVFYKNGAGQTLITETKKMAFFGGAHTIINTFINVGKYVHEHYERPSLADDFIESYVTLSFLISPTGDVENIEVTRSLHPEIDLEIVRVFEDMPAWNPAHFKGENWYCEYSITISF